MSLESLVNMPQAQPLSEKAKQCITNVLKEHEIPAHFLSEEKFAKGWQNVLTGLLASAEEDLNPNLHKLTMTAVELHRDVALLDATRMQIGNGEETVAEFTVRLLEKKYGMTGILDVGDVSPSEDGAAQKEDDEKYLEKSLVPLSEIKQRHFYASLVIHGLAIRNLGHYSLLESKSYPPDLANKDRKLSFITRALHMLYLTDPTLINLLLQTPMGAQGTIALSTSKMQRGQNGEIQAYVSGGSPEQFAYEAELALIMRVFLQALSPDAREISKEDAEALQTFSDSAWVDVFSCALGTPLVGQLEPAIHTFIQDKYDAVRGILSKIHSGFDFPDVYTEATKHRDTLLLLQVILSYASVDEIQNVFDVVMQSDSSSTQALSDVLFPTLVNIQRQFV